MPWQNCASRKLCGVVFACTLMLPAATVVAADWQNLAFKQALLDLQQLSSDEMAGRAVGSAGSLLAQQYIAKRFTALNLTALSPGYLQAFNYKQGMFSQRQGTNVLALRQGCRYPDQYIVVSAHYDHLPVQGKQIFNGADDNASGVAGMLYLAALLEQSCPAYSYLFLATDAEEHGLDGAKAFLAAPPVAKTQLRLNINLDMIARGEQRNRLYLAGKQSFPLLRQFATNVQSKLDLRLAHDRKSQTAGRAMSEQIDWPNASDHAVFRRAGIPYLYFGVDVHPQYHTPDDDWQRIDPVFYQQALLLIADSIRWLEQLPPEQIGKPK